MSLVCSLPPQLEEKFARAAEKMIKCKGASSNISIILATVAKGINLEPEYIDAVMDPQWMEGFKQRWAHKLSLPRKTFIARTSPFSHRGLQAFCKGNPRYGCIGIENEINSRRSHCQLSEHGFFSFTKLGHHQQSSRSLHDGAQCFQFNEARCNSFHSYHSILHSSPKRIAVNDAWEENIFPPTVKQSLKHGSGSTEPERNLTDSSEKDNTYTSQETCIAAKKDCRGYKRENFAKAVYGELLLEDICLACGTTGNTDAKHPLFIGGLCKEHKLLFYEKFFKYDSDGYHSCCSICCMGRKVVLCDVQDCGRCYCRDCLTTLVSRDCFDDAVKSEHWECNFCKSSPATLLRRRPEWQEEIQRLYESTGELQFPPFPVPQPMPVHARSPIRVLSVFDGIATGMVALKQLGLQVEKFIASEIDDDAIRLVQNKHSEVIHVGDITMLSDEDIYRMGPFDLLLGGSPCNDLSGANPRRRGLLDPEGTGCLFFDFYRVLRIIEPPRDGSSRRGRRPFFWLFENVVSMKGIEKRRISRFLQCEPRMADARYVSAAARPRLFWGNLPGLKDCKITPEASDRLTVQDCLEYGRTATVEKLNTVTTKFTCLYQGQARQAPVKHDGKEDILWTTELERVFGVPEHYTDVNNLGPRERLALLGRSWSVPVVRILLSPLKEYFSGVRPVINEERLLPYSNWWN